MGKPQSIAKAGAVGAGVLQLLTFVEPALSLQLPLQLHEPPNALSLPTWAIHISSVVDDAVFRFSHFDEAEAIPMKRNAWWHVIGRAVSRELSTLLLFRKG